MTRTDLIEEQLNGDWQSSRAIAETLGFPVSTVTGAMATLYKFDNRIEHRKALSPFHNRPVSHWRKVD